MTGLTNGHSILQWVCATVRKSVADMALADRLADLEHSSDAIRDAAKSLDSPQGYRQDFGRGCVFGVCLLEKPA